MGGQIWFQTKEDVGTTFYIAVCMTSDPNIISSHIEEQDLHPNITKAKVFVAIDNETLRNHVISKLRTYSIQDISWTDRLEEVFDEHHDNYDLGIIECSKMNHSMVDKLSSFIGKIVDFAYSPCAVHNFRFLRKPLKDDDLHRTLIETHCLQKSESFQETKGTISIQRKDRNNVPLLIVEDNMMNQKVLGNVQLAMIILFQDSQKNAAKDGLYKYYHCYRW
jgi:hypothetical protein